MNNIEILEKAIADNKQVSFEYQGSKDTTPTERKVSAWLVGERKDSTYVIGHQHAGGSGYAIRQYKIDNMKNLKIIEEKMSEFPTKPGDPKKWDKIIVETTTIVTEESEDK